MIHSDKLVISKRPYAFRLDTYRFGTSTTWRGDMHRGLIQAVWFRRRRGQTVACVGELRGTLLNRQPADALDWLRLLGWDPHGGDCRGRWDGERYWGAQEPEVMEQHLALLRPMLANYPAIPDGYSGWWRYPTTAERRAAHG
jgi:hypothetical protein